MRKQLGNKIMDMALKIKKELQELEQKPNRTETDNKRIAELKDWIWQLENALRYNRK